MQVPKPPRNLRKHRARAKLIPKAKMEKLDYQASLGVPIAVAVRNLNISILANTSFKLLEYFRLSLTLRAMDTEESINISKIIQDSLFPHWLDKTDNTPSNAAYYGFFPYGYWEITD